MASIDDLFKKPNLPSTHKRKLEVSHDPANFYKSAKHSVNGDAKGKSHPQASVEEDNEDIEAGPSPPPEDDDADYGPAMDDEEGRFFGSGVEADTQDAMDFLDSRDPEEGTAEPSRVKYDLAWVRRLAQNFEKRVSTNATLRGKYEDQPQKFMGSEADLDADIKALSILSEHTDLYTEFAQLGCVGTLVNLLAHENTDIAIDAIEVLSEIVDEDAEAEKEQWDAVVSAALEASLLELLVQNFARLDESQDSDRNGVYQSLKIIESLTTRSELSKQLGQNTPLVKWLLERMQAPPPVLQNTQYSAEVLSVLLQTSPSNAAPLLALDAHDIILQLLAPYRNKDPEKDSEEEEYLANLFDALAALVSSAAGKTAFLSAEGIELCRIMLKSSSFGKSCKPHSLRLLDHACGSGPSSGEEANAAAVDVCVKLVEAGGLSTLFTLFAKKKHDDESTEHILSILSSLLRFLPADSTPRDRVLRKFFEKDYAKVDKLIALRREITAQLKAVDDAIVEEKKGLEPDEIDDEARKEDWLGQRLGAGLFKLQMVDVIIAWLVAEDGGAKKTVVKVLAERDEGLEDVKKTLLEQMEGIEEENVEGGVKEVLSALVVFLV
ncbi:beta-catenin-like protein-like protein 1 [Aulographum hederae CBS 113979]|uniref:Beta-catenin-like protein-like protein 1 n=1 Tax=Aulographum hederae CBS 113979 TaxID=1176131 RepID=A0A6G1H628_9PEZI|nr:beta-catenin-like protein-like protein 1 [Aulographum hederae CBS 113979]